MTVLANKKSVMTLYTGSNDIYNHRTRIVLAEKGVAVDIIEIDPENKPEDLLDLNPYQQVPTLVDRSLVLFESRIIMEYLDERFPHPPLLPVYPVSRAKFRLMMFRIEKDWYPLVELIENGTEQQVEKAKKELLESLLNVAPLFKEYPYFLSEDFSLIDCCVAPVLWRLPSMDMEIPKSAKLLQRYANLLFQRKSFQDSLTETEKELCLELVEEF